MTIRPLPDPHPRTARMPRTAPPSNPALDTAELARRMAALERVLGR